jgi:septum formation protein
VSVRDDSAAPALVGGARPEQRAELVLASASPRRRAILSQLGLRFQVSESGIDEAEPGGGEPEAYARGLASQKADAVAARLRAQGSRAYVLGADTIVVIEGRVLNKPADDADAVRMLMALSGKQHTVITAVALRSAHDAGFARTIAVHSGVRFRAFERATAERYAASGEGRDKAGSYAVQGLGAGLVRAIDGSYSNVVGLPACETLELLIETGVLGAWP